MKTRELQAIRKASGQRVLADFALAARIVQRAQGSASYVAGAIDAPISLSLRACLETAFGR